MMAGDMMRITVRYFAVVRELTGRIEEDIEIPDDSNGAVLLDRLVESYAPLKEYKPYLRLATDSAFLSLDDMLDDGTVINVIPPVSGG